MAINLEALARQYFYFDDPVPFSLKCGKTIEIRPVSVRDSEDFLAACDLIAIDKNSINSVEVIQMPYLEFIARVFLYDEKNRDKFVNLLRICLGIEAPIWQVENKKKFNLVDTELNIVITAKEFEDIRRIILYQNLLDYDDSYISPVLKEAMQETDKLKNRGYKTPALERRIAIITAHCGISKKDQLEMSYRSHTLLFREVCGEVEFTTIRPAALSAGKAKDLEHWIYKKEKGKLDGYIMDANDYVKSMNGNKNKPGIRDVSGANTRGAGLDEMFNNFNK